MRGEALRQHILYAAKDAFLELGFERTSMDGIAARAQTSKRTLYAHFETKEKLYLAVIELASSMYAMNVKSPAEYGAQPLEALTRYCARIGELVSSQWALRMMRMTIAEGERFAAGAAFYYESFFDRTLEGLTEYLARTFSLTTAAADAGANALLAHTLFPRLPRLLFGVDVPRETVGDELDPSIDLEPMRAFVRAFIASLPARP